MRFVERLIRTGSIVAASTVLVACALLDEKPDVADAPNATELKATRGEVVFDSVGFAHEGREMGLEAVSFTAPAGKTTAIVGPSGAG